MSAICKYLVLIFLFASTSIFVKAQVGIGTNNPDQNSVLDIKSTDKGVLLPRPVAISGVVKREGVLIYDSIKGKIKVYFQGKWLSVNPLTPDEDENVTAKGNLTVEGNSISAPGAKVTANTFYGYGVVPVGGIMMWGGPKSLFNPDGKGTGILDGWALCDGQDQRPDLRGRFVVGYSNTINTTTTDAAYNPKQNMEALPDYSVIGNPQGSKAIILSNEQMPIHDHDVLNNGVHKITGNIPLTGGSVQQTVLAFDQDGLTTPGSPTYNDKIGNAKIGLTVRKAGGISTNETSLNTKLIAGCTIWRYTCTCQYSPYSSDPNFTIQTNVELTMDTIFNTDYQSTDLQGPPSTRAWPIYSGKIFKGYANGSVGRNFTITECNLNGGYQEEGCVS